MTRPLTPSRLMTSNLKFSSRRLWLLSALLSTVAFGCTPTDSKPTGKGGTTASTIQAKDRPALEVVLVDANFDKELALQWQAFSEQPIQVTVLSSAEVQGRELDATDVWIYPAGLMGEMVSAERIVPLTTAAAGLPYQQDDSDVVTTSETKPEERVRSTVDSWPSRWRATSRFGASNYALPLGAPQLVLVGRDVTTAGLDKLDDASTPQEDRTGLASEAWNALLASLPEVSLDQPTLEQRVANLTPEQNEALVDRFLWIASTTNAKRRGFFDMTKLQPRLTAPEFQLASEIFVKLALRSPETMLATHPEAWNLVNSGVQTSGEGASIAIAMPGYATIQAMGTERESTSSEPIQMSSLTFNPYRGYVVSIGKKTRQTSVAAQLTSWLSTAEQRQALSRLSDWVELWPTQSNSLLNSEMLRNYHNLNNREQRNEAILLSTRFAHSAQYRSALAKALKASLLSPDQQQEHLEKCVQEWNAITESLGTLNQRKNVEQALGFGS